MSTGKPDGVKYVTDVSAADLGARVVVRHDIGGGRATDVLGYLRSWADGVLVIESRHGDVRVPESALLAAKRIPDPPVRRTSGSGRPRSP